jgi:long-subunit acyl-CoA synthetase (AMP-forming)
MMDPVLNEILARPPAAGHRISFARLDGTSSLELAELHERAGRLAGALQAMGLRRGDRIGILAANCLEWVLLDLAALRLGVVTAGFEPGKFEPETALLTKYGLSLLFTDRPADGAGLRSMDEVTKLAAGDGPAPEAVTYEPGDVTTIKFTSGSTGEPKGLGATAGSIDSSIGAVQELFAHGGDDNLFVFLPLSLLQQRYWIYSALRFGHDVTVSTYEAAFVAMGRAQPTVVMGVPAFFETARKQIEGRARKEGTEEALRAAARKLFGERIRYLWTGSAPAAASMLEFFESVGLPIYEGYGLNEACIVAKNAPGAHRRGSVGKVLARKRVILDEDGVVSVQSEFPVNTRYEYAAPGESERIFGAGGIVRTGDLGHLDEDGFLYIRGRADDVIVLDNGRKVIVRPIEEELRACPAIEEAVVFCPTQTHLVAVVSPAGDQPDVEAIATHLAAANAKMTHDEQIRGIVVAAGRFSEQNGMLTSQFKPRRRRILEAYRAEVDAVAAQPGAVLVAGGGA